MTAKCLDAGHAAHARNTQLHVGCRGDPRPALREHVPTVHQLLGNIEKHKKPMAKADCSSKAMSTQAQHRLCKHVHQNLPRLRQEGKKALKNEEADVGMSLDDGHGCCAEHGA